MGLLKPWVCLLGWMLKRDHLPQVRGRICFIKMLGGGSLVIAYPALLGLRCQYPQATFSVICGHGVRPFAESLGVFDRIDVIDDASVFRLVGSGLQCLLRNFWVDTVVDLEVYSRLTTVMSTLTGAWNRIGFYLESVFWRRRLHTHLIFFNRFSGSFHWYDAIARLLASEPAPIEECQHLMRERFGSLSPSKPTRRIAIGHACSEFGTERMLNAQQWHVVFQNYLHRKEQAEVWFFGTASDRDVAARIIDEIEPWFPALRFQNLCGELSLRESVRMLAVCQEFWGIDSALLHYARLLGLECISFWGPTAPATRLRPIPGLREIVRYGNVPCSPCIHVAEEAPCYGDNVCIQSLFSGTKDYDKILWLA